MSNLKSVALTVFEQLAFNALKFRGSRAPGHASFSNIFRGVTSGLSLWTCLSNLKSVALKVLCVEVEHCSHVRTDTQADRQKKVKTYNIRQFHSVHLADIINLSTPVNEKLLSLVASYC